MDLSKAGWSYTIYDTAEGIFYKHISCAEVAKTVGVKKQSFVSWTGSQTREGAGEDFRKRGILYRDRYLIWREGLFVPEEDERMFGPAYIEWFANEWNKAVEPFRVLAARKDRRQNGTQG